jgi:nucleoside-diphosphate-sugar epimerase
MRSGYVEPLNLGQDRLLSIDELVDLAAEVAGKHVKKRYDTSRPQGVRGRNSDNTRLRQVLGWVPQVSLERGLELTYAWIREQLRAQGRIPG